MEAITKYKAIDGKEFKSEAECTEYEKFIERVDALMAALPKVTLPGCGFENGGGYIQHERETFLRVRKDLLSIIGERIDHNWIQQSKEDENIDPSWVGRLLSDYNIAPLNHAWYRISCTDKQYREWGQPYFKNYPHEAKNIRLNP